MMCEILFYTIKCVDVNKYLIKFRKIPHDQRSVPIAVVISHDKFSITNSILKIT